jgi:hypothetical protein
MLLWVIYNWEWTWSDYEKFTKNKMNNKAYKSWESRSKGKNNHIKIQIAANFESYLKEDDETLYNTKVQYYEII